MAYIESRVGFVSKGKNRSRGEEPGEIAWIWHNHYTARPTAAIAMKDEAGQEYTAFADVPLNYPDMHIHSHVLRADRRRAAPSAPWTQSAMPAWKRNSALFINRLSPSTFARLGLM